MILVLNTDTLINSSLTLEEVFLCLCVYYRDVDSLKVYVTNSSTNIDINTANKLVDKGYLIKTRDVPTFDDLYATELVNGLLNVATPDSMFDELIATYPSKTPNGRRLHGSKEINKGKYIKAIKKNLDLHNLIIKAVKYEVEERTVNNSLDFLSMLATYINQKKWEEYLPEVLEGKIAGTSQYGTEDI